MPNQPIKKEKKQQKKAGVARVLTVPVVSYQMVEGVSDEEVNRRLEKAYDILFREFFKDQMELSTKSSIDNS